MVLWDKLVYNKFMNLRWNHYCYVYYCVMCRDSQPACPGGSQPASPAIGDQPSCLPRRQQPAWTGSNRQPASLPACPRSSSQPACPGRAPSLPRSQMQNTRKHTTKEMKYIKGYANQMLDVLRPIFCKLHVTNGKTAKRIVWSPNYAIFSPPLPFSWPHPNPMATRSSPTIWLAARC